MLFEKASLIGIKLILKLKGWALVRGQWAASHLGLLFVLTRGELMRNIEKMQIKIFKPKFW